MRRLFKQLWLLALIVFCLFAFAAPAFSAYDHYTINVYKALGTETSAGGYTAVSTAVRYIVFDGGTKTLSTIYYDQNGNAKSNPVEATTFASDGKIDFYIANTTTTVDIAIMCLNGYSMWLTKLTNSTHTAIVDQRPGVIHHGFADWAVTLASQNGLSGAATDYWTFESDIVMFPWVGTEVITAGSVSDFQLFGQLSGTAGALFNYHSPDAAKTYTGISTAYAATDSQTIGSVFATEPCTADVRTYQDQGKPYLISTGETMTFSGASLVEEGDYTTVTEDLAHGWGFFHFWFMRLR